MKYLEANVNGRAHLSVNMIMKEPGVVVRHPYEPATTVTGNS
ncbi:hypothetical protein [Terrimonas ginsenosidimutans]|nr:hypothetical protein [Terrimonas ginsenosidimutans]